MEEHYSPRILRTPGSSCLEVWMHNNSRRERSAIDQSTGLGAKCSSPAAAQQQPSSAVGSSQDQEQSAGSPGLIIQLHVQSRRQGAHSICQTQRLACPALYLNYLQTLADACASIHAWTTRFSTTLPPRRRSRTVRAGEHLRRRQIYVW